MKPQPMVCARDVPAASHWYQQVLGAKSAHGGPEYERLTVEGELILQIHHWEADEHGNMGDPDAAPHGFGVQLWFEAADFDAAVERIRALGAEIAEEVHVNPNANHREIWLRDPDGFSVVISGRHGDLADV